MDIKGTIQAAALTLGLLTVYETKLMIAAPLEARVAVFAASGLIASELFSRLLANILFKASTVRRLIYGRYWVDGLWDLETFEFRKEAWQYKYTVTARIEASDLQGRLNVISYRYDDSSTSDQTISASYTAHIEVRNGNYINHFHYQDVDGTLRYGAAVGSFFPRDHVKHSDAYIGRIYFFDTGEYLLQRGQKRICAESMVREKSGGQ